MPNLYAPENIKLDVPNAPALLDWLAEEEPGQTYLGPNINWEKVPSNILDLLTLSDPSGMIGGPTGLTWTPSIPNSWLRKGVFQSPIFERLSKFGQSLESQYPRLSTASRLTPVRVYEGANLPTGGIGEYLGNSQINPFGKINLAEKTAREGTLAHEMLHRLSDIDPSVNKLGKGILRGAPDKLLKSLSKQIGGPIELDPEEFLPYIFGSKYQPGYYNIFTPKFEYPEGLNILEQFLSKIR